MDTERITREAEKIYTDDVVDRVKNPHFRRAWFGGYQPGEVRELLRQISGILEEAVTNDRLQKIRLEELQAQNLARETEIRQLNERVEELEEQLSEASATNDRVVESAHAEASALLRTFESNRDRLRFATKPRPESLTDEIECLRSQRDRLYEELGAITEGFLRLLGTVDGKEESAEVEPEYGLASLEREDVFQEIKNDLATLDEEELSRLEMSSEEDTDKDSMARSA